MMKGFLRICLIAALLVTMLPTTVSDVLATESSDDDVRVKVHYHRFDDNYEGWNLWLWPEGGNGASYEITGRDEFGVVYDTVIPDSKEVSNIGIIVRLNEWEAKDVDSDRFMTTAGINSDGIIEIFLVQAEPTIHYSMETVDLYPKFLAAELSGSERVDVRVTVPFELEGAKDKFSVVKSNGDEVDVKYISSTKSKGSVSAATVVMEESFIIGQQYMISYEDYVAFPISMTKVFDFPEFEEEFHYDGNDLGLVYSPNKSIFKVWLPTASKASLCLYDEGIDGKLIDEYLMEESDKGTYRIEVEEDLAGLFYTYKVVVGNEINEGVDPYAKAVGVNGDRGMIVDLSKTDPIGWSEDVSPVFNNPTDAIVYELHVRDLSISDTSGIENKGKYLGLIETGTVNAEGLSTGLDHLKELGITHLQLLPVFDYRTIDETALEENDFNWGYDPENYNVPEGSYSTDPYDGGVRIGEFKTMVKALHENDIRVIMDVVYNHTGASTDSHLNKLVPDYYYRSQQGVFTNGSGCGNEIASERSMVQKMIMDSVVYWATEYHIDGFRFDLMGLHDLDTMEAVRKALDEINPTIIVYGEGWTGGATPLAESERLVKVNNSEVEGVGVFSDDLRDGIKGHVFEAESPGFVNGHTEMEETVKFGIVGATKHQQIDYSEINYSDFPWSATPAETVNYAEAHDNLTLWDKLLVTNPNDSREELVYMDKMSSAIFLTSQGVPFIHAGMEFLRTKDGDHNSYKSPDDVNEIDWSLKSENLDVFNYYKGLIDLRKKHPAFRMMDAEMIDEKLIFLNEGDSGIDQVVAYVIDDHANDDKAGAIAVIFNANKETVTVDIPYGDWTVVVDRDIVDLEGIYEFTDERVEVKPLESLVMVSDMTLVEMSETYSNRGNDDLSEDMVVEETEDTDGETNGEARVNEDEKPSMILPVIGTVMIICTGGFLFVSKRKKDK